MADIPDAARRVTLFVNEILSESGSAGIPGAEEWVRDRLRFFILVGLSPGAMKLIEESSPEATQLRAEHLMLARDVKNFGPEHLVAWWVHLAPELFSQYIDRQFGEMRGALTDQARLYRESPSGFLDDRVDWNSFFNSN